MTDYSTHCEKVEKLNLYCDVEKWAGKTCLGHHSNTFWSKLNTPSSMSGFSVIYFLVLTCPLWLGCRAKKIDSETRPVSHALWDHLLKKNVSEEGWVDYPGFQTDSSLLNEYLDILKNSHPNDRYWSKEEQLAYWINAYNAFTIKIVAEHYPVFGIKEIKKGIPFVNSVWDIKFIEIENQIYDLNKIEHGVLRKHFEEPRIHFAINCASVSCPKLSRDAYVAIRLEDQLQTAAMDFLTDTTRNVIDHKQLALSKIFSWFRSDFTKDGSLRDYIRSFLPFEEDAKIRFLDYHWKLNDLQHAKP